MCQVNSIKTSCGNKLKIETVNGALLAAECTRESQEREKLGCFLSTNKKNVKKDDIEYFIFAKK